MRREVLAAGSACQGGHGNGRGSGPGFYAELHIDVLQVFVHRPRAQPEDVADVTIGLAAGHPVQNLHLAPGQLEALAQKAGESFTGVSGFDVEEFVIDLFYWFDKSTK